MSSGFNAERKIATKKIPFIFMNITCVFFPLAAFVCFFFVFSFVEAVLISPVVSFNFSRAAGSDFATVKPLSECIHRAIWLGTVLTFSSQYAEIHFRAIQIYFFIELLGFFLSTENTRKKISKESGAVEFFSALNKRKKTFLEAKAKKGIKMRLCVCDKIYERKLIIILFYW